MVVQRAFFAFPQRVTDNDSDAVILQLRVSSAECASRCASSDPFTDIRALRKLAPRAHLPFNILCPGDSGHGHSCGRHYDGFEKYSYHIRSVFRQLTLVPQSFRYSPPTTGVPTRAFSRHLRYSGSLASSLNRFSSPLLRIKRGLNVQKMPKGKRSSRSRRTGMPRLVI